MTDCPKPSIMDQILKNGKWKWNKKAPPGEIFGIMIVWLTDCGIDWPTDLWISGYLSGTNIQLSKSFEKLISGNSLEFEITPFSFQQNQPDSCIVLSVVL